MTVRKGRKQLVAVLPGILEDPDTNLSGPLRVLLAQLQWEMKHLEDQIDEVDSVVVGTSGQNEACQRPKAIPGIGPLTTTAIDSASGNGAEFKKGRGFAAWLGLVPSQYSTGGKQKLLGISKRGNCYHPNCKPQSVSRRMLRHRLSFPRGGEIRVRQDLLLAMLRAPCGNTRAAPGRRMAARRRRVVLLQLAFAAGVRLRKAAFPASDTPTSTPLACVDSRPHSRDLEPRKRGH
jgi:hypothetical protein